MIILATSILDLRASTPDWVDARAATCTSQLIHFDPIGGLLQFNTNSAYSINTWIQTIMFDNWQDLVQFDRGELGLPPPPAPVEEPEIPEPDIELEPEPQELSPAPGPPAQQKKPWGDLYPWYTGARLRLAQAVEALPADTLPDAPGELLVKSTETWPVVYSAYPDLINSDVKVHCNCLTGDTKIPLLNGKTISMKELHNTYGSDKHFWVYSTDSNGEFVPGKARSLGITNYVKELYYVTLDNGSIVKCTGNHRFMLRTGEYIYAKDLTTGTSLMPEQEKKYKNHTVTSVQVVKFDDPVPVYDLSVDQYENFLLDQGVIVHNCPAYLWHGSQYELETRDTELIPEGVPAPQPYPYGRAPKALSNIICKHLAAVFNQNF